MLKERVPQDTPTSITSPDRPSTHDQSVLCVGDDVRFNRLLVLEGFRHEVDQAATQRSLHKVRFLSK